MISPISLYNILIIIKCSLLYAFSYLSRRFLIVLRLLYFTRSLFRNPRILKVNSNFFILSFVIILRMIIIIFWPAAAEAAVLIIKIIVIIIVIVIIEVFLPLELFLRAAIL